MLIALGFRKQCGKDTVAWYLRSEYGFRRIALAARVKRAAAAAFNLTEDQCETEEGKQQIHPLLGITNRRILQQLAQGIKQSMGEDVWLKMLNLPELVTHDTNYVISDMRFRQEYEAFKSVGGKCVNITRPGAPMDLHLSENNLAIKRDWDYVIVNDGTIDQLYEKIDGMMKHFGFSRDV